MILSAKELRASLMRAESRCFHYRLDYPWVDDVKSQACIDIKRDETGPFSSRSGRSLPVQCSVEEIHVRV